MLDDPNFTLDVIDKKMLAMCRYTFPTISIKVKEKVKWDDIKDIFIPFINLLVKEYNVYKIEINDSNVKIFNILKDDVNSKSIYKIDILFRENQEKYRKKRDL
jgi:hypothetical protein